ncbi:MAG: ATP-binding protein [Defluviitaleaceae bacterium]|nr:ATP-binding protein [Defluviitaleaceae bacterium]
MKTENFHEFNEIAKKPIRLITVLYALLKFIFYGNFNEGYSAERLAMGVIMVVLIFVFTELRVFNKPYLPVIVVMSLTILELLFLVTVTGDRLAYYFLAAMPLICVLYINMKAIAIVIAVNTVITSLLVFVFQIPLLRSDRPSTFADEANNFMGMIFFYIIVYFLGHFSIRKLINLQREADFATRSKSSFIAAVSHEVRTPLNAIIGISEINLQKNLPAGVVGDMEKIYGAARNLLGIIGDISDISKIEAGKLEVVPKEYDTASFINDTVHLNIVRIGSKRLKFILEIDDDFPSKIIGDELRIKQILNNLLSNAIKYTEQGFVKLTARHELTDDELWLVFTVEDSGQGIKEEDMAKIFTKYTRFNSDANRFIDGTGLGLVITQQFVELMNGTILAESEYGMGSKFTVRIAQSIAPGAPPLGAEVAKQLRGFSFVGSRLVKKQFDAINCESILVVDDVESNLYVAQEMLALFDIEMEAAMSGKQAIKKVQSGKTYDLIFMDHMMPGMDGVEATKILRESGYDGKIIALTANATADIGEMFIKNGFDDFISKPIDTTRLGVILKKWT